MPFFGEKGISKKCFSGILSASKTVSYKKNIVSDLYAEKLFTLIFTKVLTTVFYLFALKTQITQVKTVSFKRNSLIHIKKLFTY